jgi:hypothetical protein
MKAEGRSMAVVKIGVVAWDKETSGGHCDGVFEQRAQRQQHLQIHHECLKFASFSKSG